MQPSIRPRCLDTARQRHRPSITRQIPSRRQSSLLIHLKSRQRKEAVHAVVVVEAVVEIARTIPLSNFMLKSCRNHLKSLRQRLSPPSRPWKIRLFRHQLAPLSCLKRYNRCKSLLPMLCLQPKLKKHHLRFLKQ